MIAPRIPRKPTNLFAELVYSTASPAYHPHTMLLKTPLIGLIATLLSYASPLMAQLPSKPGPPPTKDNVIAWLIIVVMMVAVVMTSVKNSKRGDQD
jgi:hypothetical protein